MCLFLGHSELQSSGQCAPLGLILVNCISKIVTMFNVKCEQMVFTCIHCNYQEF